jgi:hypothetical protein
MTRLVFNPHTAYSDVGDTDNLYKIQELCRKLPQVALKNFKQDVKIISSYSAFETTLPKRTPTLGCYQGKGCSHQHKIPSFSKPSYDTVSLLSGLIERQNRLTRVSAQFEFWDWIEYKCNTVHPQPELTETNLQLISLWKEAVVTSYLQLHSWATSAITLPYIFRQAGTEAIRVERLAFGFSLVARNHIDSMPHISGFLPPPSSLR